MALSLHDVRCEPVANRALSERMQHYTVAEEKSRLVLTKKSGDMKLFLFDLDDLHQLDFFHNQQMVKEVERLQLLSRTIDQQRDSWKVRALMAEVELLEAAARTSNIDQQRAGWKVRALMAEQQLLDGTAKTSNNGGRHTAVTSGTLRSSAIWQSGSTLITPPEKGSRRSFEMRSSRKSGTRLTASTKESRAPASRRRDHFREPDRQASLRSETIA